MAIGDFIRGMFGARGRELEQLSAEQQEFLNAAADMGSERLHRYGLYEHYYEGEHHTQVLDRAKLYLQASGLRFCENVCETVVDVHAGRLAVVGFEVPDNEQAADWLTGTFWPGDRMDGTQGTVHVETLKKGDGFLIVEWNHEKGLPRACWNPPEKIKPVYDDDGETLLYAAKVWTTARKSPSNPQGRPIRRLNLHFPERVEKWFALDDKDKADWAPFIGDDDQNEQQGDDGQVANVPVWPTPWTTTMTPDGDPLGINVFHFRNKAHGRTFGRSILRSVIPMNDALNKQALDLFQVMDTQGWKQRWAAGISDASALTVAIGEWVSTSEATAKFGEFDAEDPVPLQKIIDGTLQRIAALSRTPLHDLVMSGEAPSGEALKTAESGVVAASKDRHTPFGNTWEDVARMGWRLADVFGQGAPPYTPDADVTTVWDDPRSRDELAEANTYLVYEELGVSKTTIVRRLGFDPDEEAKLRAAEAEESAKAFGLPAPGDPPPPVNDPPPPAPDPNQT
jgi:SPP1 Gp6-like portal protein